MSALSTQHVDRSRCLFTWNKQNPHSRLAKSREVCVIDHWSASLLPDVDVCCSPSRCPSVFLIVIRTVRFLYEATGFSWSPPLQYRGMVILIIIIVIIIRSRVKGQTGLKNVASAVIIEVLEGQTSPTTEPSQLGCAAACRLFSTSHVELSNPRILRKEQHVIHQPSQLIWLSKLCLLVRMTGTRVSHDKWLSFPVCWHLLRCGWL